MTVKVAILGTGWGTRVQVPCFRAAGLEVTAVWAHSREAARRVAVALGIPYTTTDYRALLAEAEVDLVSVVSPPHLHREMAVAALEAGKHVLAEKPTALDATEAEVMVAAARAHPDQLALLDHELRFLPSLRFFHRLVAEGWVGEVWHAEGVFNADFRREVMEPWGWWSERSKGGGMLGALGSHLVDSLGWILGRPVVAVAGHERPGFAERTDSAGWLHPVTADDYAALLLRFEGGVLASVQLSALVAGPPVFRLSVTGADGTLVWQDGRLTGWRQGLPSEDLAFDPPTALPPSVPDRVFPRGTMYLAGALKQRLEDGNPKALAVAATFEDGLATQRVLDAARSGGWIELAGRQGG